MAVHRFSMLDTGIGREAGYANDAEFIAAVQAERAELPPVVREALEMVEETMTRALLFGPAPRA